MGRVTQVLLFFRSVAGFLSIECNCNDLRGCYRSWHGRAGAHPYRNDVSHAAYIIHVHAGLCYVYPSAFNFSNTMGVASASKRKQNSRAGISSMLTRSPLTSNPTCAPCLPVTITTSPSYTRTTQGIWGRVQMAIAMLTRYFSFFFLRLLI